MNSEWLPIDTAPVKTRVLAWDDGVFILAQWDFYGATLQHPQNPSGDHERKRLGVKSCYEWRDCGDGEGYNPTHWMPLPEGPIDIIQEQSFAKYPLE